MPRDKRGIFYAEKMIFAQLRPLLVSRLMLQ